MFLDSLIRRNKKLIEFTKSAFEKGLILPNSYVLDLDSIKENARLIKKEADKYNIDVFQMTKQFGRNPIVAKAIESAGIKKSACVDFQCGLVLNKEKIKIGNIGHLVQIPNHLINKILKLKPEVVTVFNIEKINKIAKEAKKLNVTQDIILRVVDAEDTFYEGQHGGFDIKKLDLTIKKIKNIPNVNLVGFTSFPNLLFNGKKYLPTNNLKTINKAIKIAKKNNVKIKHINSPSGNSVSTIKLLKKFNTTHIEPGHALTGTIPTNSVIDEPEIPSILYVSEVSHKFDNKAFFFGGGYYPRGHFDKAIVYSKNQENYHVVKINKFDSNYIDYYLNFDIKDKKISAGDIVISSFRTQIFTTRSLVFVVKGLSKNKPKILETYSSQGDKIEWI